MKKATAKKSKKKSKSKSKSKSSLKPKSKSKSKSKLEVEARGRSAKSSVEVEARRRRSKSKAKSKKSASQAEARKKRPLSGKHPAPHKIRFIRDISPNEGPLDIFKRDASLTKEALDAHRKIREAFSQHPGVTAVDIGKKGEAGGDGEPIVRIHVTHALFGDEQARARFPRAEGDIEVVVIPAEYERHGPGPLGARFSTLRRGISVSHRDAAAGSLGLFAFNRAADRCIVSNDHVFRYDNYSGAGDPIIQPGRGESGSTGNDGIATLADWHVGTDSAVAILNQARPVNNPPIAGIGDPWRGRVLTRHGRTTGARAIIDGVLGHDNLEASFRLAPLPGATDPICARGDSGSVWYDEATNEAVGLHCAGSRTAGDPHAVAVSLWAVFHYLDLGL